MIYQTIYFIILISPKSIIPRNKDTTKTRKITIAVEANNSLRVGHFTFLSSILDSRKNWPATFTYLKIGPFFTPFFSGSLLEIAWGGLLLVSSTTGVDMESGFEMALGVGAERGFFRLPFFFFFLLYFFIFHMSLKKRGHFPSAEQKGHIKLAGQEGFEPPTPGFGVRCSNR